MTTKVIAAPAAGTTPDTSAPAATTQPVASDPAPVAAAPVAAAPAPVAAPAAQTPAAAAPAAPAAPAEPAAPAPKAPTTYDFKGTTMDPTVLTKFEGIARELDMSQEQAKKLVDTVAPEIAAAQKARHDALVNGWAESAKTDPEFGGEKLVANLAVAKEAMGKVATPELVKFLNETGLGNHPDMIRLFYRLGAKVNPGAFVPAGQGKGQPTNPGAKLYPDMK